MSLPYLSQDKIDEIECALRDGGDLEFIAGQVGYEPEDLSRLLGRPQWRRFPSTDESAELDLFAAEDKLEGLL